MDSAKGCCVPARTETLAPPSALPTFRRTGTAGSVEMRRLAGGEFLMGTDGSYGFAADGEGPAHAITLKAFLLDATCVTNEQYNGFVHASGYKTESERFGWSFVFYGHLTAEQQATTARARVLGTQWWCQVPGATWRHPEGPGTSIKKRWNLPVVHVSWNDALSYAAWAGKRLPTEAEWEYAARGGMVQKKFPWGDELEPAGRHRMNVWQGKFPEVNTAADGYVGVAPAKSFPANGYGLYNMTGNIWEWCWDFFDPGYYRRSPAADPIGPETGDRRVLRGGSYLCHASYCNRYRTDARSSNTPDSAAGNVGFRCAADIT